MKLYEFKPDLVELISPELYERSRELALRLAADAPAAVLSRRPDAGECP